MRAIPRHLCEQLHRHNVIPFIGAGVSCGVRDIENDTPLFPDWKTLLEKIHEELLDQGKISAASTFKKLLERQPPDYLGAAEIGWQNLQAPNCPGFLMEIFNVSVDRAKKESLELARSLWNLGSRLVVTTNFDPVLEWVCPKPSDHRLICRQNHGLAQILQNSKTAFYTTWHLHGSVLHDVENIVFNQTQYDDFYRGTERTETALRTLLSSKTFLFIGFSLSDHYFCKNLVDIHRIFNGAANSFYVLVKRGTWVNPLMKKIVTPIEFDDFEVELPKLVNEMCRLANLDAVEELAGNNLLAKLTLNPSVSYAVRIMIVMIVLMLVTYSLISPNLSPQKLAEISPVQSQNDASTSVPTATKVANESKQIQTGAKKTKRETRDESSTTEEARIKQAHKESGATISVLQILQ